MTVQAADPPRARPARSQGRVDPVFSRDLESLVARVAEGDEVALEDLYDATVSRVLGWTMRVLRERTAAEEACLDVFSQVWRKAGDYDPARAPVLGWLLTLARTRAIDVLRSRARRGSETSLDPLIEMADGHPGPEATAALSEDARRVRIALAGLVPEQRVVIEAAFFGGMSHAEVAAHLGLPLGTAKTRIRLGLLALRRALGGDAPGTEQREEGWA